MSTISTREAIQTKDVYTGVAGAPVILVCYMDYESAPCAKLNEILNELLQTYQGKVRVNIRHFPMANKHQKAMKAAEAAVAAAQEGLFWEMNNILFENRSKLGTISLQQYARQAGCKNKRFLEQLINGLYAWQVREDLLEAVGNGILAAPAVFINGELFGEEINVDSLSKKVEEMG